MSDFSSQLLGDNWPIRRRLLFTALTFFAGVVCWLIWLGLDSLAVQIVVTLIGAMTTLISVYVFGAIFDDKFKRTSLASLPSLSTSVSSSFGSALSIAAPASEQPSDPDDPYNLKPKA